MGTITVTDKQQRQAEVLTRLIAERLTIAEASQLLGLSVRQIRRKRQQFEEQGIASLIHGNQGKMPPCKTDASTLTQIIALAGKGGVYHGFSVSHLCDLLDQKHDIRIGRSTLDRLLKQTGVKRTPRVMESSRRHVRRDRKPAEGMLIQIDGSTHAWLEERGPRLCLIGGIDDATNKIVHLRFHASECQEGYLMLLEDILTRYGLPMALYHDKHTILRSPKKATIDDELAGREPMSQIQRILSELGIESIAAQTPQAKGRIERLWQTLQDRLVKEMRLAKVTTIEEANAFLDAFIIGFNERFCVEAMEIELAWIALPADFDRSYYLSIREERTVKSDQTIAYGGQEYRIMSPLNYRGSA